MDLRQHPLSPRVMLKENLKNLLVKLTFDRVEICESPQESTFVQTIPLSHTTKPFAHNKNTPLPQSTTRSQTSPKVSSSAPLFFPNSPPKNNVPRLHPDFQGITENGIRFYKKDYAEMDFYSGTLEFSKDIFLENEIHYPITGSNVCGIVEEVLYIDEKGLRGEYSSSSSSSSSFSDSTNRNRSVSLGGPVPNTIVVKKFKYWFYCSPQFIRFVNLIEFGEQSQLFYGKPRENIILEFVTSHADQGLLPQETIATKFKHVYCVLAYVFYFNISLSSPVYDALTSFPPQHDNMISMKPIEKYIVKFLMRFGGRLPED
jgi:hypothetical protein